MTKSKIENELIKIGYNPIHIGTIYLIEAIYIVYNNSNLIYELNLEKDIYKKLSKKYNKNAYTIKSNIIKATNAVDIKNFISSQKSIQYSDLKLTPKLVIWLVIKNIKKQ